jgi:hypothetical protein
MSTRPHWGQQMLLPPLPSTSPRARQVVPSSHQAQVPWWAYVQSRNSALATPGVHQAHVASAHVADRTASSIITLMPPLIPPLCTPFMSGTPSTAGLVIKRSTAWVHGVDMVCMAVNMVTCKWAVANSNAACAKTVQYHSSHFHPPIYLLGHLCRAVAVHPCHGSTTTNPTSLSVPPIQIR